MAREFGWTPKQTDEQPAYLIDWLLNIMRVEAEVQKDKNG